MSTRDQIYTARRVAVRNRFVQDHRLSEQRGRPVSTVVSDEKVALFLDWAANLRSSRAVASLDLLGITMSFDSQEIASQVDGPDDEATTTFFIRVREFDTPSKPVYVPDYFSRLEEDASPGRMEVVAWLREAHTDLGKHPYDWHKSVLGPDATPRDVWELWAYSHHLHPDEEKRKIWANLQQFQQGMAKFVAYAYATELFHLVTVVEAMLRDPGLDHRGVEMLIFGTRPEFASVPGITQFRAARVRLASPA
jgi:hypothetical protein